MKKWLKAAGIRAVKTFAQTMISFLTIGQAFGEVDWMYIISISLVASLYSILTSVAGLPELKE